MTSDTPALDLAALRQVARAAEAATPTERLTVMRYDHGGGRVAIMDGNERHLVADYYDEANREYYVAANPRTLLAVLDRLEAAERQRKQAGAAVVLAQEWVSKIEAERDAARAALVFIQEMAAEDLRCGRDAKGSSLWQIEANARAALAADSGSQEGE